MNLSPKILFISYDGLTDPLGQSQILPYLIGLTKHNYAFTILSCDKPHLYKKNKSYILEIIKDYPIKWVSIPYHKKPPVFSSIFDFYKLKKTAKALYLKEKFDMVHTRPGVPTLVALWLKKKYAIKFLNDIRGFWADERVDGNMWNLKNPLYKKIYIFFKRHEYDCIEKADYNTCLTYNAKREIHSWKNIAHQPIPIEVIPCSVNTDIFNPDNIDIGLQQKLKRELKIEEGDFVICYLGSIGGWYLTDEMMEFFKLLNERIRQAKFLFISPHRHELIIEAAKKHAVALENIILRKGMYSDVPLLLSLSNYSIFFIKPCYSKISSSPTKHGEIMAMGIPVITNSGVGDVEEITNKYNSGFVLQNFTKQEYNRVIDTMVKGVNFDKSQIVKGEKEYYNLESAIEKYARVYIKILS